MWKIIKIFPDPEMMLQTWKIDADNGKVYSLQQKREIGVLSPINGRVFISFQDKNGKKHTLKRSHIIYYFAKEEMPPWGTHVVDHHDQDRTNDSIDNLQSKTKHENRDNTRKRSRCSSRYKGVSWDKKSYKWMSKMRANNETHHCGRYDDEIEAAQEYDKMYWQVKKSILGMNFPELLETYKMQTGVR